MSAQAQPSPDSPRHRTSRCAHSRSPGAPSSCSPPTTTTRRASSRPPASTSILVGRLARHDRARARARRCRSPWTTWCARRAAVSRAVTQRARRSRDMPFMCYQADYAEGMRNAGAAPRRGRRAGRQARGRHGRHARSSSKGSTAAGIPVMGHVGLTPQSVNTLGGYRTQGKDAASGRAGSSPTRVALAGGRRVRDRARVRARRACRAHHARCSTSRPSASAPASAATARCRSSTTCSALGDFVPRHAKRYARPRRRRSSDAVSRVRRATCAAARFPGEDADARTWTPRSLAEAEVRYSAEYAEARRRGVLAVIERIASKTEVRSAVAEARREGKTVGLRADDGRAARGPSRRSSQAARERADVVVVSIFVNPTQFAPGEDFERYPRRIDDDIELLGAEGVELVFTPSVETMYDADAARHRRSRPARRALGGRRCVPGTSRAWRRSSPSSSTSCAPTSRSSARRTTSSSRSCRRMARDLDLGVGVVGCPIVRDADGLALSSRNAYLSADERDDALALPEALEAAAQALAWGERERRGARGRDARRRPRRARRRASRSTTPPSSIRRRSSRSTTRRSPGARDHRRRRVGAHSTHRQLRAADASRRRGAERDRLRRTVRRDPRARSRARRRHPRAQLPARRGPGRRGLRRRLARAFSRRRPRPTRAPSSSPASTSWPRPPRSSRPTRPCCCPSRAPAARWPT